MFSVNNYIYKIKWHGTTFKSDEKCKYKILHIYKKKYSYKSYSLIAILDSYEEYEVPFVDKYGREWIYAELAFSYCFMC